MAAARAAHPCVAVLLYLKVVRRIPVVRLESMEAGVVAAIMDTEAQPVQLLQEELEAVSPQVPQLVRTALIILAVAVVLVLATTAAEAEAEAPHPCLVTKDTQAVMVVSVMVEMVEIPQALLMHTLAVAAVPEQAGQAM